jgi:arsenite-transporting ATPase
VLRLELPFASKGEVSLKKIGLELVVRVGESKRVIELPSSLASLRPSSATFADGALVVTFEPVVPAEAVQAGA